MKTTVLSQPDIQAIVAEVGVDQLMDELIVRLGEAIRSFDPQQTSVPVRDGFSYTSPRSGLLEWMPMLQTGQHVLMKMVGYHPQNPDLGNLPTILSDFSLYNATTGQLEAVVDGTLLTAFRTGAASAIASRFLAKADSRVVGLIGCGAQAVTQLHALTRVFGVQRVCFFDADFATMDSFEQRCRPFASDADFAMCSFEEILEQSDIISIATTIDIGAGPVFDDLPTQDHLHINAVGSDFPNKFELPVALLKRSFVTPDVRAQAEVEGECQQLDSADVGEELYQLMQRGDASSELKQGLSVFDSTGWVLEDYVVTKLFLEHARRLGLGTEVWMGTQSTDPKSPYVFLAGDDETVRRPSLAGSAPAIAPAANKGGLS